MELNSSPNIRNDFRPILEKDGSASCLQKTKEFPIVFNRVLAGYGMPVQVRRFVFLIWCLAKPGKVYALTDYFLAQHLGKGVDGVGSPVSRNYISKLRKKYLEWTGERAEIGTRNYRVVGITENVFDWKTKKQKPTEYVFNSDFAGMLGLLVEQIHAHRLYKENWIAAIEAVVSDSNKLLGDYGMLWHLRPQKRPRTPDNIIGTYLLKEKRITRQLMRTFKSWGYDPQQAADFLKEHYTRDIDTALAEVEMATEPTIAIPHLDERGNTDKLLPIRQSKKEFEVLIAKSLAYVEAKEAVAETVLPLKLTNPNFSYSEASTNGFIRGDSRQIITDAGQGDGDRLSPVSGELDIGEIARLVGEIKHPATVVQQRELNLQKSRVRQKQE